MWQLTDLTPRRSADTSAGRHLDCGIVDAKPTHR